MTSNGQYDGSLKAAGSSQRTDPAEHPRGAPAQTQQTVFDEICANLDGKLSHLIGLTTNLRAKVDRLSGSIPPEIAKERGQDMPEAAIARTFLMLDIVQERLTALEHEINRLDSIAGC